MGCAVSGKIFGFDFNAIVAVRQTLETAQNLWSRLHHGLLGEQRASWPRAQPRLGFAQREFSHGPLNQSAATMSARGSINAQRRCGAIQHNLKVSGFRLRSLSRVDCNNFNAIAGFR